jgi:hypothetical protein
MIRRKMLADGVMEIRLIGDDGELDAIVELTRPTSHALLIAHLLAFQDEVRAEEACSPSECRVLPFLPRKAASA